jgi:arylsulfatase
VEKATSALLPIATAKADSDETFNVGLDTGTPVDDQDYQVPFRFTGKINKLTVKLGPNEMAAAK